jgi:hypothetical protein
MKSVTLIRSFAALFVFTTFINAQEKSKEQAVRRVVADFAEAINRGDAKAFAALFAEDADFVVITGKSLKGLPCATVYRRLPRQSPGCDICRNPLSPY